MFVQRLRYLGDLPLSLDLTYLTPDIGTQILDHPLETNDLFALIEQVSGHRLGSASLALEEQSRPTLTQQPRCRYRTDPRCSCWNEFTSLDDGRPVDLEYIRMRGDRITMSGHLIRSKP